MSVYPSRRIKAKKLELGLALFSRSMLPRFARLGYVMETQHSRFLHGTATFGK